MSQTTENPAALATRTGPGKSCSTADAPGNKPALTAPQAPITEIEREFRRDEVFEAAGEASNYLGAIQNMVAADDVPGLRYCASKFVAYARVIASGCKVLTAGGGR